jgi:hypothetical protein
MIRYALVKSTTAGNAVPADSHNFLDGLQPPEQVQAFLNSLSIDGHPPIDFIDNREKLLSSLVPVGRKNWRLPMLCARTAFANTSVLADRRS